MFELTQDTSFHTPASAPLDNGQCTPTPVNTAPPETGEAEAGPGVSQSGIGIPARNPAFGQIIGQERAKVRLEALVNGSQLANAVFPSLLLLGPSGHGKTELCKATALAMGAGHVIIRCSKDLTISDLIRNLQDLRPFDVVILDEIHSLKTSVQVFLLAVLDGGPIQNPEASGDPESRVLTLPPLSFLATTTRCAGIYSDLRNRFSRLELEPYSLDEMAQMAEAFCRGRAVQIQRDAAIYLAGAAFGTPRNINLFLSELVLVNSNRFAISMDDCKKFLLERGLHGDGWDASHHKYLASLRLRSLSRSVLLSVLKVDDGTLEDMEACLLQSELIIIEKPNGRTLTHKGHRLLAELETMFNRRLT